jgi:hypothetical protein
MKPGDLVRVVSQSVFWRETTSPLGHRDFHLHRDTLMILVDAPWTVQLDHPERGRRKETYVRVLHPEHGVIRGFLNSVEAINETR